VTIDGKHRREERMAWRTGGDRDRDGDGDESLDAVLEEIERSVGDPASMVRWCERALRHDLLRDAPWLRAAVLVTFARGLRDREDGDRGQNLERAREALEEAVSAYERVKPPPTSVACPSALGPVSA
jgi:hypothetical protein